MNRDLSTNIDQLILEYKSVEDELFYHCEELQNIQEMVEELHRKKKQLSQELSACFTQQADELSKKYPQKIKIKKV